MANTQSTYQTNVVIAGNLDASLLKALGMTQAQFVQMQKNAKQTTVMLRNMSLAANGLPPALARANVQVNHLNQGMGRFQGLVQRLLIYRGIYAIAGGIRNATDEMGELLKKSLEVAGAFERQKFAMSNIMGNQVSGSQVATRLAQLGQMGYGTNAMMDLAKKLSAQGVPSQNIVGTTKELANINAAAGGSREDLERLTDMYGRVMSKGYVEKRSAANFGKQGIPMMEELVKLYGGSSVTGPGGDSIRGLVEYDKKGNPVKVFQSGLQKVQEMLAKQMISTRMFQLALKDMVSATGFAADGMERYSHTWEGAVGVFQAKSEDLMRALGNIEMNALQPLLDWFNQSGFWGRVKSWLSELRMISESFTTYMEVVGGPQVLARIKAASDVVASLFGRPEFKQVHAGENVIMAPTAGTTGAFQQVTNWLKEFVDISAQIVKGIHDFFAEIFNEVKSTLELISALHKDLLNPNGFQGFSDAVGHINKWGRRVLGGQEEADQLNWDRRNYMGWGGSAFNPGGSSYAPGNFPDSPEMREYIKTHQQNTDAVQRLTDTLEWEVYSQQFVGTGAMRGTGGMIGGDRMSDRANETYYEHPDTEGRSSQYGPNGNRLGYGFGVGLGRSLQAQGHPIGSWVKIRTANGRVIWRQVNETSARNHGVEFVTPHADEKSYGNGPSTIIDSSPTRPENVTINYHVHAIDSHDVHRFASEHAETLAKHIKRAFSWDHSRSAVV